MNRSTKIALLLSGGLEPEAMALFARQTTPLSLPYRNAYNRLIKNLKSCGAWQRFDGFHFYAAETSQQALLNWVSASYNGTVANGPSFNAGQGYRGNGANSSIQTGYNFSMAGGKLTQNDGCIGAFVLDGGSSTSSVIGGGASGTFVFLRPYSTGGKISAYFSTGGTTEYAVKSATGLSVISRTASNQEAVYRDGTLVGSPTNASSALPNALLQVLTGDGSYTNHLVSCVFWGASLSASQVSAVNSAIRTCLAAIGTAVVDPVAPYGVWRGAWNSGGNAKSGSVAVAARDVMSYSGNYYFCISGYTTSTGDDAPDVDTTHWEVLPIFDQVSLFDDNFETGAGAFDGRQVDGLTWRTSGTGYLNAVVVNDGVDGYATSVGNTYHIMDNMIGPVTELEADEWDLGTPGFTLSIGGDNGVTSIFQEMIHVNFSATGLSLRYWHDGASGQLFDSPLYSWFSSWVGNDSQRYLCKVQIRGKFLFCFVDGALEGILCHDMVATLGAVASEIYVQTHTILALGEQRHYRVSAAKAAA